MRCIRWQLGCWERSTVWAVLRNSAYRGFACFVKTRVSARTRVIRPQCRPGCDYTQRDSRPRAPARPTLPSAHFCGTVKVNRTTLSHASVTRRRSPEVSSTAFAAQPPDLPPVSLMDMGFAVICPLSHTVGLLSGSCSSARVFAPRFFQAPPHGECYVALALR
jgi:hypothetical protein